jgi:hypothetical protein
MSLVTITQAKQHMRLGIPTTPTPDSEDADVLLKMASAEAMVLDYIGEYNVSPQRWTDETDCDPIVQAAILMVFAELYAFRGDQAGTIIAAPARDPYGSLSPIVEGMLRRFRTPVLA